MMQTSDTVQQRRAPQDQRLGVRLALMLIRGYQLVLSPWIGRQCRFYPTCSHYAAEAIHTHGLLAGGWLMLKRIGKCHPFHPGGVDLVPGKAPTRCAEHRSEQDL